MKKLPNFLIVGTAKSGTTSLVHYLKNNPKIFIPDIKEPRYFSYDFLKENGYKGPGDSETKKIAIKSRGSYEKCFNKINEQVQAIGEASVETSFYYENTIPKIKNELGDPKILILLRDPVRRAISAYSHLIREGRETLKFEEAIKKENYRRNNGYEFIWSYIESGLYYNQIKAFQDNFSDVKVIIFEEFINNPDDYVRDVLSFLEISEHHKVRYQQYNISGKPKNKSLNYFLNKPLKIKTLAKYVLGENLSLKLKNKFQKLNLEPIEISKDFKKRLHGFFIEDIIKVEKLIDKDLTIWKEPYS